MTQAEKKAHQVYPHIPEQMETLRNAQINERNSIRRPAYIQGRTDLIQEINDKLGVIVNTSKGDDVVMDVINLLKELK